MHYNELLTSEEISDMLIEDFVDRFAEVFSRGLMERGLIGEDRNKAVKRMAQRMLGCIEV